MELYNKAIVYYSALSDEKHLEYLQKLQRLFSDAGLQKILAAAPQESASATTSKEERSNEQEESKNEEEEV